MAAGVSDRLWEVLDIVALVEAADTKPGKRGPNRCRSVKSPNESGTTLGTD